MATRGGQPGNKNGSKGKLFEDVLKRALLAEDGKKLREIAEMLVDKAVKGDMVAAKELLDRFDGKPKQPVEHSGDADNPVHFVTSAANELLDKIRGAK